MKKPILSQSEALRSPKQGLMASIRGRARHILSVVGFSALSSVAGCAIDAQDINWQQYRGRTDGDVVTPDSGVPDGDGGPRDADSGAGSCLPAGDIMVSGDNVVNLSDMRNSVAMEIPFSGNCDALGGTMLAVDLNDGLAHRQNVPVLQVDNTAHVIRSRLDLSTLAAETPGVSAVTALDGNTVMGRFNIDFIAPAVVPVSEQTYSLSGGPYGFRATFNSPGRLMVDFLRDSDEISLVPHGDTTTACTTSTEASACSMAAPDGSGRTQGCATARMVMLPVPARACDIREGRIWEYPTAGLNTLFSIDTHDHDTVRSIVPVGQMFKLRMTFIDNAGNAWTNIYRVMRSS